MDVLNLNDQKLERYKLIDNIANVTNNKDTGDIIIKYNSKNYIFEFYKTNLENGSIQYVLQLSDDKLFKTIRILFGFVLKGSYDPNIAYIAYISRNDSLKIDGNMAIQMAIAICDFLGTSIVYLHDESSKYCDENPGIDLVLSKMSTVIPNRLNLLLFNLLTKGMTWYMKFGFMPYVNSIEYIEKDYDTTIDTMVVNVELLRNVKMSTLLYEFSELRDILNNIILSGEFTKVKLSNPSVYTEAFIVDLKDVYYEYKMKILVYELFYNFSDSVYIINKYCTNTDQSFSQFLTELNSKNCNEVVKLLYYLFDNHVYLWNDNRGVFPLIYNEKKYSSIIYVYMMHIGPVFYRSLMFLKFD